MEKVTFKGRQLELTGSALKEGSVAPDFLLTDIDLNEVSLEHYGSPYVLLNIVPSLDTPVCAASAREFDRLAHSGELNCSFLTISRDLPFAQSRFCEREGIHHMSTLSDMRFSSFAHDYGVLISEGPLKGLCARAVFLLGPADNSAERRVLYRELVNEIAWEPDYEVVIRQIKALNRIGE